MGTQRKSKYTPELADRICRALADGASLRQACLAEGVSQPLFYEWLDSREGLAEKYARARALQNERVDDELRELAATTDNENARANETKFRILTWIAGKRAPKNFGDKLQLAGDKDAPLRVQVEMIAGSDE